MKMHIFQKAQVTLNKNAHNLQHHFGAQFFMLFHMVWLILFGVLGRETTFSLVEVLQPETSISRFLELTRGTKWITPCERAWKTVSENGVGICLHFYMRSFMPLERCVEYTQGNPSSKAKVVCACHPCEVFFCRDDAKKGCFSKIEKNIISSCHLHITLLQLHTH